MSEKPSSTLGYERRFNRFLRIDDEGEFVRELTGALEPQPPNFRRIVELNRGPLIVQSLPVDPLAPARVRGLLDEGAVLIDGREPREFDAAHVPGAINVTMVGDAVGTRAAWVVDPESPVVVAAPTDAAALSLGRLLEAVGFRDLRGSLAGGMAAWEEAGLPLATTAAMDVAELAEQLRAGAVDLLDVRDRDEWDEGHVEGSLHVPYYELRDGGPDELGPRSRPLAVACSVGNRSSIATSLLERAGVANVVHVVGGGVPDLAHHGIDLVG